MTTPIEVTDEMRQAVHDDDCARLGHQFSMANTLSWENDSGRVLGPAGQLPHLTCGRCGKTWLVVEEPGEDYDDAVTKLRGRMKDPDSVNPRPRPIDQPGPAPSRER